VTLAPYGWLMLGGIAVSFAVWRRMARRDPRLLTIYLAALAGAFLGAKVVYFFAEGYLHLGTPDMWPQLATGKSILGGLLGGYAAVEVVKRLTDYPGITGDWFALIVPVGISLGRVGCWINGCCQGIECHPNWFTVRDVAGHARWPAVPMEILFNLMALITILCLRTAKKLPGQHFHLYLIGYGVFRFLHEFVRDEPHILGPLSGYQIAALAVLALGVDRFMRRRGDRAQEFVLSSEEPSAATLNLKRAIKRTNHG
jgi:phosphatidylglycerol:prolipoprotein diacylglycerol transferase